MALVPLVDFGLNPVLECSAIKATFYNTVLTNKENKQTFVLDDKEATICWWENKVCYISISAEQKAQSGTVDGKDIPAEIIRQITEFLSDRNNYRVDGTCGCVEHRS
jgi:hypothetical protein